MAIAIEETGPDDFESRVMDVRGPLIVVEFWGDDCPNCEVFERDMPGLLEALDGSEVRFVRVDAYRHPELARRFGLFGVPTFLLFRDGKRIGKMSQYSGRAFWLGVVRDHLPGGAAHR